METASNTAWCTALLMAAILFLAHLQGHRSKTKQKNKLYLIDPNFTFIICVHEKKILKANKKKHSVVKVNEKFCKTACLLKDHTANLVSV